MSGPLLHLSHRRDPVKIGVPARGCQLFPICLRLRGQRPEKDDGLERKPSDGAPHERASSRERTKTMFELSWLFWLLVATLFAESWGRVLARAGRSRSAPAHGSAHPET